MQSIKLHSHVGEDGILQLEVPVGLTNMDLEVTVTVAPVQQKTVTPEELGWPPGFFERTAGCLQDEPLVRYPQVKLQEREPLE